MNDTVSNGFRSHRALKLEAKKRMSMTAPVWIKATFLFVALQVALTVLASSFGGRIGYYLLSLTEYPNAVTGLSQAVEGLSLIVRLDLLGIVLALPLSYQKIKIFLLLNLFVFLLLTPMKLAITERYCMAQTDVVQTNSRKLFRWYYNLRLTGKAFLVEGLLLLGYRVLGLIALLPSTVLYYLLYSGNYVQSEMGIQLLALGALLLTIAGGLTACFLYTTFLPLRYVLATSPEDSLGQILRQGFSILRGARGKFLKLHVSFLPWYLIAQIGYGVPNLYIFPYATLTSLLFLQETHGQNRDAHGIGEPPTT